MTHDNPQLVVLLSGSKSEKKLLNIFRVFDINHIIADNIDTLKALASSNKIHLLLGCEEYRRIIHFNAGMFKRFSSVFVYGVGTTEVQLTSEIMISDQYKDICREFSGLSFNAISTWIGCFPEAENPMDVFVSTGKGQPVFFRKHVGHSELYFLSTEIQDVNIKLKERFVIEKYFLCLVPVLMYLNHIIPNCVGGMNKFACVVIDDPYLRMDYGYFNYNKIVSLMEKHNFSITVAFIPWNYKKTDRNIVNILLNNKNKISICAHGCNHTKNEYMSTDLSYLNKLTELATSRMIAHEEDTGLSFDRVMVFPQGKFTNQAMDSMKANNYLAAMNTSPISTNLEEYFELKDYFGKYIVNYGGFPLFTRNTPDDAIGISNNLFFGKPVFLVIHHEYLKDDYKGLITAVNMINLRSPGIQWASAGKIIDDLLDGDKNQKNSGTSGFRMTEYYGIRKKTSIYIRREFCNFRDNYISKNNAMMFVYNCLNKTIKG